MLRSNVVCQHNKGIFKEMFWGPFHLVLLLTELTALATSLSLPSEEVAKLNKEEILIEDGNWK